jgi:pimeloyl-ACP methyl ester carboxylesterase
MPWFDADVDVRLFYTIEGEGEPLLLVHGWGCDSTDWIYQIPDFARDHRVIAVDNRGHGRSGGRTGLRPQVFASDLAALLDALATGPVVALGHSLGGSIATALAVEHPELVRGLVIIDPAYGVGEQEAAAVEAVLRLTEQPGTHQHLAEAFTRMSTVGTPAHLKTWHRIRALGIDEHVLRETFSNIFRCRDQFAYRAQAAEYLRRRCCPSSPSTSMAAGRRPRGRSRSVGLPLMRRKSCLSGTGYTRPGSFTGVTGLAP